MRRPKYILRHAFGFGPSLVVLPHDGVYEFKDYVLRRGHTLVRWERQSDGHSAP